MNLRAIAVGVAVVLAASPAVEAINAIDVQRELRRLHQMGASGYVQHLYREPRWATVMNHISSGDRNWLSLARQMMPGADGAAAEELTSSLGAALLYRPADVLRLLPYDGLRLGWTISITCHAPFPSPGKAWLIKYRAKAIKAVARVHEPALKAKRAECLRTLRGIDLSQPAHAYE